MRGRLLVGIIMLLATLLPAGSSAAGRSWESIIVDNQACDFAAPEQTLATTLKPIDAATTCPSPTTCYAIYLEDSRKKDSIYFAKYDSGTWSTPTAIFSAGASLRDVELSCRSTTDCLAVFKRSGRPVFMQYDGSSWSAPAAVSAGRVIKGSLSCNATECAYVFSRASRSGVPYVAATSYDGTWSAATVLKRSLRLQHNDPAASCYPGGCLAVWRGERTSRRWDLRYASYAAGVWSGSGVVEVTTKNEAAPALGCADAGHCFLVYKGDPNPRSVGARTFDGAAWSAAETIGAAGGRLYFPAVASPYPGFATVAWAANDDGRAAHSNIFHRSYDGGWDAATALLGAPTLVSRIALAMPPGSKSLTAIGWPGAAPSASRGLYASVRSCATTTEICDGVDNDGDGLIDEDPICSLGVAQSAQIQAARDAGDGAGLTLPLSGAVVTAVKPAVGLDPAGFFVQAQQAGPALFVAVDPAGLSPVPVAGDAVAFTITEMGTVSSQRRALAIDAFSRIGTGATVALLAQEVSAATDLVSALDSYESEVLAIGGTLGTAFAAAGTAHVSARLDTTGISGDAGLVLRIPEALQTDLVLEPGCTVTLAAAPMWRFNATAQPSAWRDAEIAATCPAASVNGAVATSATAVTVAFTRKLDAASVDPSGSQFTFTGGLTASAAVASEKNVVVTTSSQTPAASYTVTVATSVKDVFGTALDGGANAASFNGFDPASLHLVINEVDYDNPGTDTAEFVEIYNPTAAPIDLTGYAVVLVNGNGNSDYGSLPLTGTIAAGGYAVVGPGTLGIQNGAPDGLVLIDPSNTVLDALSYEGSISAATITGVTGTVNLVEGTATPAADESGAGSLQRCPNGSDTDDAATDWRYVDTLTMGSANSCL